MLNDDQINSILRLYPRATGLVVEHMKRRLRWCQYDEIAELLGGAKRVLDVGCGFGHFGAFLQENTPEVEYWGCDPDTDKIAVAKESSISTHNHDMFFAGDFFAFKNSGKIPLSVDGVVLIDILYLMPDEIQKNLIRSLCAMLSQDGIIVIKTLDTTTRDMRYYCALLQEYLMVHILKRTFSVDKSIVATPPERLMALLEEEGFRTVKTPLPQNRTPSVLIAAYRS